jgi:isopentenyl-diphosphate Delta-isomerase
MIRRRTPSLRWRGGPFAGQSEDMEPVVLLSEDGTPIGIADKARVHAARTPLHLGFSCYAFDASDRLLVTRRAAVKRTFPGLWTNTCCGHPLPREPLESAVARRLDFELGLTPHALILALPDFRYRASMKGVEENELCPVFLCRVLNPPLPNPDEVADFRWQAWPAYAQAAARAEPSLSPWSSLQVRALERDDLVRGFLASH